VKFGISMNMTWHGASPTDVARTAERLGFESMWMGEHIFIPVEIHDPKLHVVSAVPPEYKHMADPFIWLTAAAVATTRLRLGFNICLVPQRHPIVLAKQLASLDRISGGRISFGAGAGWIKEEAEVMGFPLQERWARTMEYLRVMRALWSEEAAGFEGRFISFPPIHLYPKPVQEPMPILIGSGGPGMNNSYALKRVAEVADGWIPCFLSPDELAGELETLRRCCADAGRDFDALEISIVLPAASLGVGEAFASMGEMDRTAHDAKTLIAEYARVGAHRVVVGLVDLTTQNYAEVLQSAAEGLGLA
jgi:probable F420-dependent oxidoreductase